MKACQKILNLKNKNKPSTLEGFSFFLQSSQLLNFVPPEQKRSRFELPLRVNFQIFEIKSFLWGFWGVWMGVCVVEFFFVRVCFLVFFKA